MNLARGLAQREAQGKPVRVGLIGAGKFGTMILAQLRLMTGVRLCVLADLDPERARRAGVEAGWDADAFARAANAGAANDVARGGRVALVESGVLATECELDVLIEATGHEEAGALHAYRAIERGLHVVMVTVEADVVIGPYLHRMAERAGVVYSMAYGDQPAIICELVDWARTCGFDVVSAGKGTKYAPRYRRSTPDTAFANYGFTPEQIATGGFNPKMFNSFLDGTKSAIEMVAVANATGLDVSDDGLSFAPASVYDLPEAAQTARGRRHPAARRHPRRGVVHHARREVRRRPYPVGRVRDVHVRERLRETVLRRVRHRDRCERTVRRAVAALSFDRAGDRRVDRVRGAAR